MNKSVEALDDILCQIHNSIASNRDKQWNKEEKADKIDWINKQLKKVLSLKKRTDFIESVIKTSYRTMNYLKDRRLKKPYKDEWC